MFLLVPAHLGCPGQIPQSRKTVVCVCVCVCVICSICIGSNLCACVRHKSHSLREVSAIIAERRADC